MQSANSPLLLVATEAEYSTLRSKQDYIDSLLDMAEELSKTLVWGWLAKPLWRQAREQQRSRKLKHFENLFHVTPEVAVERFRFDIGHPNTPGIYLCNPCDTQHYFTPAIANERLVQQKMAAFVDIASCLGATAVPQFETKMPESLAFVVHCKC